jgi:hypothetical protein
MHLTEKQLTELRRHSLPGPMPSWGRPNSMMVAAALYRKGFLDRAEFSERGLHDDRRLTWWEYQLTETGHLATKD